MTTAATPTRPPLPPNTTPPPTAQAAWEWDIASNQQSFWGVWDDTAGAAWPGIAVNPANCQGAGCCLSNCLGKVALTSIGGKLSGVINTALTTQACYEAYRTKTPEALANCAANVQEGILKVKNVPVLVNWRASPNVWPSARATPTATTAPAI